MGPHLVPFPGLYLGCYIPCWGISQTLILPPFELLATKLSTIFNNVHRHLGKLWSPPSSQLKPQSLCARDATTARFFGVRPCL